MSKSRKQENKSLDKWELFSISLAIAVYFFYMKTSNGIINYPRDVLYSVFFCLYFFVSVTCFKKISSKFNGAEKDWLSRVLFIGSNVIKFAVISWVFTGILLIPFNYYNIYVAGESKPINESVEIEKLVARARNNSVFFKYNGRMNVVYGHKPLMNHIYNKQDIKKYYIVLDMNEGLLGSYVLNRWDILLK